MEHYYQPEDRMRAARGDRPHPERAPAPPGAACMGRRAVPAQFGRDAVPHAAAYVKSMKDAMGMELG